jgi:ribosome-associated protein
MARRFAIDTARLAANTRCHNVVVLDVTDISPVTDFYVIATGTSARQMRTVCDDAVEQAESRDYRPMSTAGYEGDSWLLVDFVDVVLHVFNEQSRGYYDLDNLWGDASRVDWQPDGASNPQDTSPE